MPVSSIHTAEATTRTDVDARGWMLMARFRKMAIATEVAVPAPSVQQDWEVGAADAVAAVVADGAVKATPPPRESSESDRLAVLRRISVGAPNPGVAAAAVHAAAQLRCLKPGRGDQVDCKATGIIARFLIWAAFSDVIDPARAFTRANVDEYLTGKATVSDRSVRQLRYILYGIGRELHPQEFPSANTLPASRRKRLPAASRSEIGTLQAIIPGLPGNLAGRAQALLDLTYGAGARSGDFKSLRGTAITSVAVEGRAIAVVTLPNTGGGVRQVPVVDPKITGRLLGLAARVGTGLVLAPHVSTPDRNIVNRVNSDLRRLGHPRIDPIALRNRWVLNLAATVPAALLLQLADVGDLRVLVDQRHLLPTYKLRHAITLLKQAQQ